MPDNQNAGKTRVIRKAKAGGPTPPLSPQQATPAPTPCTPAAPQTPAGKPPTLDDVQTRIHTPKGGGQAGGPSGGGGATRIVGASSPARNAPAASPCSPAPQQTGDGRNVVGWLVVVNGPGKGNSRNIYAGLNTIGRDDGEAIPLNFGDDTISRTNHASIAYDDRDRKFYITHGGKANLVRLNGGPVLEAKELAANDELEIGNTTVRFVPFCGPDFDWQDLES